MQHSTLTEPVAPAVLRLDKSTRRIPAVRLAYILSASHSGSTLLAMLLGSHAEACTAGELKATSLGDPDRYRCSCGSPIKQCAFWKQVQAQMAKQGIDNFDITNAGTSIYEFNSWLSRHLLQPLYRGPFMEVARDIALGFCATWRAHLSETQRRNVALVQSLHTVTGAKVIVDSSKVALRLKYLLREPCLDIKIIRLVRDGRAVSLTYTDEWNFADAADPARRGGGSGVPRETPSRSMSGAAHEWKRSNQSADCLIERLPPSQWIKVRYEDVCKDPANTIERLCDFLDLDPQLINLDFRSRQQHVIGNGMRFDRTSDIRIDERWRAHLSRSDLDIFQQVAGDLNGRYGYGD